MKTISKIIIILLVAAVVAGVLSLAVSNNMISAGPNEGGQPPAMTSSNASQPIVRPEGGDREGGSPAGGVAGVPGTLLKITGITLAVILFRKAVSQLGNLKWKSAQR